MTTALIARFVAADLFAHASAISGCKQILDL
jgi:hypothetical protein